MDFYIATYNVGMGTDSCGAELDAGGPRSSQSQVAAGASFAEPAIG